MYQEMYNIETEQEKQQLNELLERQNKARLPNEIRRVYSEAIKKEESGELNDYGFKVLTEIPKKTNEERETMSSVEHDAYLAIEGGQAELHEARQLRIKDESEFAAITKNAEKEKAKKFVAEERAKMSIKEQLVINAEIDSQIQGQI
jgi:hypothetical protein